MLEEIIEDDRIGLSQNKKVSQEEIRRILHERERLGVCRDGPRAPLGEALVEQGILTREQLQNALRVQGEKGGKIGSVLVELGYVSDEVLLRFLGEQHGLQCTNLMNINIAENVMSLLPSRVILKYRVLPLKSEGRTMNLAMESPGDLTAIHEVEFLTGKRVNPVIVPSYQMDMAIKHVEEKGAGFFSGREIQEAHHGPVTIASLLENLIASKGSDLLLTAGVPPTLKINIALKRISMPSLSPEQCMAYAKSLMTERQWEDFLRRKELDFALDFEHIGRFRVNAYRQRNTVSVAIRRITDTILSFEKLGLPQWLEEYVLKPQGLILVTSPTGHGKTTSVAAMIDFINSTKKSNIITLEDPIEYIHKSKKCNVNQREVGPDTDSFSEGLRRVFRQAPDIIVIGEMRDQETFEIALRAASTGHLVLSTMHSSSATAAIDSMVNRFPSHLQAQVRQQMSDALLVVFSQRLLPTKSGDSVVLAYEKLINSYRIKNFIRENKVHQIRTQIQLEADDYASIDVSLGKLMKEGRISRDNALLYADNPDFFSKVAAR
jgi:twitching motility protein PilT